MKFQLPIFFALLFLFTNCSQLPKTKLSQSGGKIIQYDVVDDSLKIQIDNPLHCPIRISASSSDKILQEKLSKHFPVTATPNKAMVISYWTDRPKEEMPINFSAMMGNPNDSVLKMDMNLPFKKGRQYEVIQGYNGSFSHSSEYSKYALDLNLAEGDTICAAADGFVVGVIEGYTKGGRSKKWQDYANYITIFHPEMNLYTQYVHLMPEGSFVEVGEHVKSGQDIGRSGKTGRTDIEHLHFNVLRANDSGMQSEQIGFKEGYKGADLKRGDSVKR